jgi:ribonuclease R
MFHHETTKNEAKITYIYRVHDTPNMDKVEEFIKFARGLGYKIIAQSPENVAKAFAKLLKEAEGKPEVDMLQQLAIRTMAKAVYSTENIGHYGLAFETYTHFTSPIRRYSDVLAHRILAKNLNGKTYRADLNDLTEQCKHISLQERKAADAERESIKYKQVEYMQDFVGQTFTGVISGLIERGLFVSLLENYCEGMIVFSDMTDDYYELIPGEYAAAGRKHGKRLRMGDEIKVKIISTNLAKRQIEMQRVF